MALKLVVNLVGAYNLPGKNDPYVKFKFGSHTAQSEKIDKTSNPEWDDANFEFKVDDVHDKLEVEVYDKKLIGADNLIVKTKDIGINRYIGLGLIDKRFPLFDKEGDDAQCEIHLKIEVRDENAKHGRDLMRQMKENQGSLRDLTLKSKQDGEEIDILKRDLSQLRKTQNELEKRYSEAKEQIEKLEASNSSTLASNMKLRAEKEELEEKIAASVSQEDYEQLQSENESLFRDLESKNSEIDDLNADNVTQQEKIGNLTKDLEASRNECQQVETDLKSQLKEMQETLETTQNELERSRDEASKNAEDVEMAVQKAQSASQQEAEQRLKSAESENERLNEALSKLAEEYQEIQGAYKELKERERQYVQPPKKEQPQKIQPKPHENKSDSAGTSVFSLVADGAVDAALSLF